MAVERLSIKKTIINYAFCIECENPAVENHHVVPHSKGGTFVVPLCSVCHDKVHDRKAGLSISILTKQGKQRLRDSGKKCGRFSPYGYSSDAQGNLIECCIEQSVIKEMKELRIKGYPYRSIANYLNNHGRKTKSGSGRWFTQTVSDILARETKKGPLS